MKEELVTIVHPAKIMTATEMHCYMHLEIAKAANRLGREGHTVIGMKPAPQDLMLGPAVGYFLQYETEAPDFDLDTREP